jgi:hypothetical protein
MMLSCDDDMALAQLRGAARSGETVEAGRLISAGADINSKDFVRIRSAARGRGAFSIRQSPRLLSRAVVDA